MLTRLASAALAALLLCAGAASAQLLAVRLTRAELKAAVFAAGIYDFRRAHDAITIPGIRENMEQEAGLSDSAAAARTSLTRMAALPCPVLILHGENDENAPASQAYALRDTLTARKKEFELKMFPSDHNLGMQIVSENTLAFFQRMLGAK